MSGGMTHQQRTDTPDGAAPAMEAIAISKDFRLSPGHVLHAVREVSFDLHRGTATALVGESGSPPARSAWTARLSTCQAAGPSGGTRAKSSWCSRTRSLR